MDEKQARAVIAYAENNMNAQKTADALHYHRNSVVYHLISVRKKLGKNPMKFYDLCELLPIARAVIDKKERDR